VNILITSAGRRVSLVSYFQKEAKELLGASAKVFTTDLYPEMSSACLTSDKGFKVGRFTDPDYMDVLLELCLKNDVKLIIPTIDTELLLLAQHRDKFLVHGIHSIVSDEAFITCCRDKRNMNAFFEEKGFKIPGAIDIDEPKFPIFIKPYNGSSSKDIFLIKEQSMLADYMKDKDRFMHLVYLSPKDYKEYTIDLYYDKFSKLKCIVPRVRIAVRGGETNKGITQKHTEIVSFVKEHVGSIEGARGCLTLQIFHGIENGEIYGIEINPRFGGGYPLSYLAGANYPNWLIKEYLLNQEIQNFDSWEDNLLLLRHDNEMLVHGFDYK